MKVKHLDLLLTFRCPSMCRHCSYRAGPERRGYLLASEAERYLEDLARTHPLESVCVHGGEPTLYFGTLKRIIAAARRAGVPDTWVITNAHWASTASGAKRTLAELKRSGLRNLTLSADGFHQEFIPLENVKLAAKAASRLGFNRVCVDSYYIGHARSENPYDEAAAVALEALRDIAGVEVNAFPVSFEGRAADELLQYALPPESPERLRARRSRTSVDGRDATLGMVSPRMGTGGYPLGASSTSPSAGVDRPVPAGRCRLPRWIGGSLRAPETIEIDHEANVTLCPGISIGNARRRPLLAILDEYDVARHPILSVIAGDGPRGLCDLALSKMPASEGRCKARGFVNECHLCYEMRRVLHSRYPECLTPAACYHESPKG